MLPDQADVDAARNTLIDTATSAGAVLAEAETYDHADLEYVELTPKVKRSRR